MALEKVRWTLNPLTDQKERTYQGTYTDLSCCFAGQSPVPPGTPGGLGWIGPSPKLKKNSPSKVLPQYTAKCEGQGRIFLVSLKARE